MANKTYAIEWLLFFIKNLNTAKLLFDAKHYEDIVGIELQQSLEKLLKSIFANENIKIQKDHDLVKLYYTIEKSHVLPALIRKIHLIFKIHTCKLTKRLETLISTWNWQRYLHQIYYWFQRRICL